LKIEKEIIYLLDTELAAQYLTLTQLDLEAGLDFTETTIRQAMKKGEL
jgi:hypothetical protein